MGPWCQHANENALAHAYGSERDQEQQARDEEMLKWDEGRLSMHFSRKHFPPDMLILLTTCTNNKAAYARGRERMRNAPQGAHPWQWTDSVGRVHDRAATPKEFWEGDIPDVEPKEMLSFIMLHILAGHRKKESVSELYNHGSSARMHELLRASDQLPYARYAYIKHFLSGTLSHDDGMGEDTTPKWNFFHAYHMLNEIRRKNAPPGQRWLSIDEARVSVARRLVPLSMLHAKGRKKPGEGIDENLCCFAQWEYTGYPLYGEINLGSFKLAPHATTESHM